MVRVFFWQLWRITLTGEETITRKDYELIAKALCKTRPNAVVEPVVFTEWSLIVREIAAALASDNERFRFIPFYTACGGE